MGSSGPEVSRAGLGCNNFGIKLDLRQSRAVVHAALDHGVTLFDTADNYGASESILGRVLSRRRDEVVLATKFGARLDGQADDNQSARGSRRYIRGAVERSLSRLRTDRIDLYQLHFPDRRTPIAETLAALSDLIREGKVRYIGVSNIAAWQLADADWTARSLGLHRFISIQREYSLLDRTVEREVIPACIHFGVGLLPYYPLASGLLTGKYRQGEDYDPDSRMGRFGWARAQASDQRFGVVEKLRDFAVKRGLDLLTVAMGWLATSPGVMSVIAGATTVDQVQANVRAALWRPSPEDCDALDEIVPPGAAL